MRQTVASFAGPAPQAPTVLITGSTDGIGLTTAKNLAVKGYNVLIHGRDSKRIDRAQKIVQSFVGDHATTNNNNNIWTLPPADISTKDGCYQLVDAVKKMCTNEMKLSVILNNAGVYAEELRITPDGFEETFAVNVLAPFIITSHLLPVLLDGNDNDDKRIIIASSLSQCRSIRDWDDMHYERRPYSAHGAYSESKLLDAMLTMEMSSRLQLQRKAITCNCLDPGTVNTKMLLAGWGPIGIEVEDALDETWLCSSDEVRDVTGKYFVWKSERRASSDAYDTTERAKLWSLLSTIDPDAAAMWDF